MSANSKLNSSFLYSELKRIADWIQFSDKKSAFLSSLNIAMLGFVISQKDSVFDSISMFDGLKIILYKIIITIIVASFTLGMYFLIRSIFPKLKNQHTDRSLCYFGNIANMKFVDFFEDIEKTSEEGYRKNLIEQIYTLSLIANQKMKYVQKATISLVILTILVIIFNFIF